MPPTSQDSLSVMLTKTEDAWKVLSYTCIGGLGQATDRSDLHEGSTLPVVACRQGSCEIKAINLKTRFTDTNPIVNYAKSN